MKARVAAVLSAFLVGACASDATLLDETIHQGGYKSLFAYGAADRDLTTVIVGNPFPMADNALGASVTEAMQGNHLGPRTHFTTTPSENARPEYRVVMMFDPPESMNARQLCGDPVGLPQPIDSGRLRLWSAFCVGPDIYSDVKASIPRVVSPEHPAFRQMVASSTWNLWPERDPFLHNECVLSTC